MIKKIEIILFLFLSLLLFTSCGHYKTRNNGKVNISVKLPKEMKPMSDKLISTYFNELEPNSSKIVPENFRTLSDTKIIGYQWDNNRYTTIILTQEKLKKEDIKASKDLQSFAAIKNPNIRYTKLIKLNGVEVLLFSTDMGIYSMFAIKNRKIYNIYASALFTGDLDENEVLDIMTKSTKFGANGIIKGVIDGVLFPVKGIIHLFNKEVRFFATSNNGFTYILGFIVGVILLLIILGSGSKNKEQQDNKA